MSKVFIICGHGGKDPGACANGYQEAERVRALAERIKYYGGDEVMIGDTSRDWYADKLVNNSSIPSGSLVVELHLDSAAASAKGGHVIIKKGFDPDQWDNALAEFISGMFPGRAEIIVGRDNLANVNRAAAAGINYRLLECCFISNASDIRKFNSEMDELAKGILRSMDVEPKIDTSESETSNGERLEVNGKFDEKTIRALQQFLKNNM